MMSPQMSYQLKIQVALSVNTRLITKLLTICTGNKKCQRNDLIDFEMGIFVRLNILTVSITEVSILIFYDFD